MAHPESHPFPSWRVNNKAIILFYFFCHHWSWRSRVFYSCSCPFPRAAMESVLASITGIACLKYVLPSLQVLDINIWTSFNSCWRKIIFIASIPSYIRARISGQYLLLGLMSVLLIVAMLLLAPFILFYFLNHKSIINAVRGSRLTIRVIRHSLHSLFMPSIIAATKLIKF